MDLNTEILGVKTFTVKYDDGTKDIVTPVLWKNLQDVQILQHQILEAFADCGGSPGDLITSDGLDYIRKLAKLLPVVGKAEPGIDIDKISYLDTLISIFVTRTTHTDELTGYIRPDPKDGTLLPSEVSRINGINFFNLLLKVQEKLNQNSTLT